MNEWACKRRFSGEERRDIEDQKEGKNEARKIDRERERENEREREREREEVKVEILLAPVFAVFCSAQGKGGEGGVAYQS